MVNWKRKVRQTPRQELSPIRYPGQRPEPEIEVIDLGDSSGNDSGRDMAIPVNVAPHAQGPSQGQPTAPPVQVKKKRSRGGSESEDSDQDQQVPTTASRRPQGRPRQREVERCPRSPPRTRIREVEPRLREVGPRLREIGPRRQSPPRTRVRKVEPRLQIPPRTQLREVEPRLQSPPRTREGVLSTTRPDQVFPCTALIRNQSLNYPTTRSRWRNNTVSLEWPTNDISSGFIEADGLTLEERIWIMQDTVAASNEVDPLACVSDEMVSTTPGNHKQDPDQLVTLKIKDLMGYTQKGGTVELTYQATVTLAELFAKVATKFDIWDDFELTYQSLQDCFELSTLPSDMPLTAANLFPSKEKVYTITINPRRPVKAKRAGGGLGITKNLDKVFQDAVNPNGIPLPELEAGTSFKREFVGLKNTSMTCYLNSTLQGLFFTPEFRNLVYVSSHVPKQNVKSICNSLKKLFLFMQFSSRDSVGTDELTKTFGWNSRDTWHQQDIQELISLLMENLITEFKGTPLEGSIKTLYYGECTDYVKCLECEKQSSRIDQYLVLPVALKKPNGQPLDNPTLEEAIKDFITPELLDGANQYFCEDCKKKVDAHKGMSVKKIPKILTVLLKRFGVDYAENKRFKLNEKLAFPLVLNMNRFMEKSENDEGQNPGFDFNVLQPQTGKELNNIRTVHSRPFVSLSEADEENWDQPEPSSSTSTELDFGSDRETILKALNEMRAEYGPEVYQLFGIFVHRGGLYGGHYFSYLRDLETYRWYRCDDSSVRKANVADIKATFGDAQDRDAATAYLLMYRRYDDHSNILPFLLEQLPPHTLSLWEKITHDDKKAKDYEMIERNTVKVVGMYRNHESSLLSAEEILIPKSYTTKQTAEFLFKHYFPDVPVPPEDQYRLCRFDRDLEIIENSWDDGAQYLTYSLKNPAPVTKNEAVLLEVISAGETFFPYFANDVVFITQCTQLAEKCIVMWAEFHIRPELTVGDLRAMICVKWKLEDIKMALRYGRDLQYLPISLDHRLLSDCTSNRVNHLYVESIDDDLELEWLTFITDFLNLENYILEFLPPLPSKYDDGGALVLNRLFDEESCDASMLGLSNCEDDTKPESSPVTDPMPVPDGHVLSDGSSQMNMTDMSEAVVEIATSNPPEIHFEPFPVSSPSKEGESTLRVGVQIDGRLKLSDLSNGILRKTNIPEDEFIFMLDSDDSGDELEILDYSKPIKDTIPRLGTLKVRFCQRLKADEGRVGVFYIDILDTTRCGFYAGDVVLHPQMTLEQTKLAVWEVLKEFGPWTPEQLQLRKKLVSDRLSKIFREEQKVGDWLTRIHDSEIVIQTIPEDRMNLKFTRNHYAFIFREWNPSEWTLGDPEELVVCLDHTRDAEVVIAESLYKAVKTINPEDMEAARVEAPFPYNLNPVAVSELEWAPVTSTTRKKAFYLYGDELVLFVRDKKIPMKAWTDEEARAFRKENDVDCVNTPSPRREQGLRMNLKANASDSIAK